MRKNKPQVQHEVGEIITAAANPDPNKYLLANGGIVLQADYPDLFDKIRHYSPASTGFIMASETKPLSATTVYGVATNGSRIVVMTNLGAAYSDDEGDTWSASTSSPAGTTQALFQYVNGYFVAAAASATQIYYSADGDTWTAGATTSVAQNNYVANANSIIHDGTNYILKCAQYLYYTSDIATGACTQVAVASASITSIAYDGYGTYVCAQAGTAAQPSSMVRVCKSDPTVASNWKTVIEDVASSNSTWVVGHNPYDGCFYLLPIATGYAYWSYDGTFFKSLGTANLNSAAYDACLTPTVEGMICGGGGASYIATPDALKAIKIIGGWSQGLAMHAFVGNDGVAASVNGGTYSRMLESYDAATEFRLPIGPSNAAGSIYQGGNIQYFVRAKR